jgi:hypothetical protein
LPVAIYLIILIHLVIKEMKIDPDNGSSNHGRGGFGLGAGRKQKEEKPSIQIILNERRERATRRQEMSRYRAKLI